MSLFKDSVELGSLLHDNSPACSQI